MVSTSHSVEGVGGASQLAGGGQVHARGLISLKTKFLLVIYLIHAQGMCLPEDKENESEVFT